MRQQAQQTVIQTVLSLRAEGMTTLSIPHHPNTAINANNILVLSKDVKIDQSGTYEELLEAGGQFADLVRAG